MRAETDDVAVALVENELGLVGTERREQDGEEAVQIGETGEEGAGDVGGEEEVIVEEEREDQEGWEVEEEGEEHCCVSGNTSSLRQPLELFQ